jgi:hypothetical protein
MTNDPREPKISNGHEWWMWRSPAAEKHGLPFMECCKNCGFIRRADDRNKPCKGHVKVGLR